MRTAVLIFCVLMMVAPVATAQAQGKPLPPPAQDAMPPVELGVALKDGKPVCTPAELRLPADTNVELRVASTADRPVVLTMQGQFEDGRVLHHGGDVAHVASEKGYTIKANGRGLIRIRTQPPGGFPMPARARPTRASRSRARSCW